MKSSKDAYVEHVELFMNELQADMQIFQLVLQEFLANTLAANSSRKQILAELQRGIRRNIETSANVSSDLQDGERLKQVILARCDRFFAPLNRLFDIAPPGVPPKNKAN